MSIHDLKKKKAEILNRLEIKENFLNLTDEGHPPNPELIPYSKS